MMAKLTSAGLNAQAAHAPLVASSRIRIGESCRGNKAEVMTGKLQDLQVKSATKLLHAACLVPGRLHLDQCACDGNALALPARQQAASVAHRRGVPLRQLCSIWPVSGSQG
jgi:hypothetical protein